MAQPTALQRLARRALLIRAKADAGLLALVAKASIDPVGVPSWPFISIEAPTARPLRMSCVRGGEVSFDVHAFAGPKKSGEVVTMTGYDHASAIGAAIESVFADNWLTLEDGSRCRISFSDVRMLRDQEPESWHWFGQMNCRVLAPVS